MEEHVRVWPEQLEALLGLVFEPVRHERGLVAGGAAGRVEDLFATQNLRIIHISSSRDTKITAVECHQIKPLGVDIETSAIDLTMRGVPAVWLSLGAFTPCSREERAGNADVSGESTGRLLFDRRHSGLQAEPSMG